MADFTMFLLVAMCTVMTAQTGFDTLGRPLFEVNTPPVEPRVLPSFHHDPRPQLAPIGGIGQSSPSTGSMVPQQQPNSTGNGGPSVPLKPSTDILMKPPSVHIDVLNSNRIKVEGFLPIEKKRTVRRIPDEKDFFGSNSLDGQEPLTGKLVTVKSEDMKIDKSEPELEAEGSGSTDLPFIHDMSSFSPELEDNTEMTGSHELKTTIGSPRFHSNAVEVESSNDDFGLGEEEEGDGSGEEELLEPKMKAIVNPFNHTTQSPTNSIPTAITTANPLNDSTTLETTSSIPDVRSTASSKSNSSTKNPAQPPAKPSANLLPSSKVKIFLKKHVGLVVGVILGIPAVTVLCYFIYLKRRRRQTGSLNVSPTNYSHKKRQQSFSCDSSRHALCTASEENELAGSPNGKAPSPPPLPHKKCIS